MTVDPAKQQLDEVEEPESQVVEGGESLDKRLAAAEAEAQAQSASDGASQSDDEVVEEADYEVIDEEEGATKS